MLFYCFFVENGGGRNSGGSGRGSGSRQKQEAEGSGSGRRNRRRWQGVQCENHVVARGSMLLVRQIFHFITYFPIPVFVDLLKNISRSTKLFVCHISLIPSYQAVSVFFLKRKLKAKIRDKLFYYTAYNLIIQQTTKDDLSWVVAKGPRRFI